MDDKKVADTQYPEIDYREIFSDVYLEVTRLKSQAKYDVEESGIGEAALTAYEKVLNIMDEKVGKEMIKMPWFDPLSNLGGNV